MSLITSYKQKSMQEHSTTAHAGIILWDSSQKLSAVILLIIAKVLDKLFHLLVIFPYTFLQKMKTVLHCKDTIINNWTLHQKFLLFSEIKCKQILINLQVSYRALPNQHAPLQEITNILFWIFN